MSEKKEYVDYLHEDKCYTCIHGNVCIFRNDIHKVVKDFKIDEGGISVVPIIPICSFFIDSSRLKDKETKR